MVSRGGLDHFWEAFGVGSPVEFAGVDYHAAHGGAVAADPFGCGVYDYVGAVGDGTDVVAACAECVVDLEDLISVIQIKVDLGRDSQQAEPHAYARHPQCPQNPARNTSDY